MAQTSVGLLGETVVVRQSRQLYVVRGCDEQLLVRLLPFVGQVFPLAAQPHEEGTVKKHFANPTPLAGFMRKRTHDGELALADGVG